MALALSMDGLSRPPTETISFSFGMSTDGKKLYLYGAGFEIEVYDAATLKYEKTWDLNNDVTMAGMIALP